MYFVIDELSPLYDDPIHPIYGSECVVHIKCINSSAMNEILINRCNEMLTELLVPLHSIRL